MTYAHDGYYRANGFDVARERTRGERIARIDALATLLDTALVLPGTNVRFGLDALLGVVPGIGDLITTAMALYIVHEARQLGAPGHVFVRMLANVALDGIVGAVPVLGDAFDVMWRSKPTQHAAAASVAGARERGRSAIRARGRWRTSMSPPRKRRRQSRTLVTRCSSRTSTTRPSRRSRPMVQ